MAAIKNKITARVKYKTYTRNIVLTLLSKEAVV